MGAGRAIVLIASRRFMPPAARGFRGITPLQAQRSGVRIEDAQTRHTLSETGFDRETHDGTLFNENDSHYLSEKAFVKGERRAAMVMGDVSGSRASLR